MKRAGGRWELIIHDSPESVEEALWGVPLSEIESCGFDGAGDIELSPTQVIESRRREGVHGFADTPGQKVHFWFAENVDRKLALSLIAHELSHALFGTEEEDATADGDAVQADAGFPAQAVVK